MARQSLRDRADYLDNDEFKEGLNELLELAERGRPDITCSEVQDGHLTRPPQA